MVQMATPWLHPSTGVYYLRRQIPVALRPAFEGRALFKQSLFTKDVARAAILFVAANAELERRFEEVRNRLRKTGSPTPTDRDRADELVHTYFNGPAYGDGGLTGAERLELARLEIDRGLWNTTPRGLSRFPPVDDDRWWELSLSTALFRSWEGRRPIPNHPLGSIWQFDDRSFEPGSRDAQVGRVVRQIARFSDLEPTSLPDTLAAAIAGFLDNQPLSPSAKRRTRRTQSRLKPDLRMGELFQAWKETMSPSEQTAHEYEQSLADFLQMVGDLPVSEITNDDLLDYRDEARKLPRSMPRADRNLPFSSRVAKHAETESPRISTATLKKRVGAIQAMLSFAFNKKWIESNAGAGTPIEGHSAGGSMKPRNFEESEMEALFSSRLFLSPETWRTDRKVTDSTLYWLFLLGLTTGARIEEVGQALVSDVKISGSITYIDIDDYVSDEVEASKSLKTVGSRRLIPIHDNIRMLGFDSYLEHVRKRGEVQLFPDLRAAQFGKHTKEASRTANRLIDRIVSEDHRLRFHSFRHQFKDFALEAGITDRVADQLTGHAPTTIGGRYGSGVRLPKLAEFLHQIDWSFIDWTEIEHASLRAPWSIRRDRV